MVLNSNPWFYHEAYGVSLQTWRWNPHNVSAVKICSVLSETKVPPLEPMVWSVIFLRKSTCHWGYAGVNKQCQLSKNQNHFKQVLSIFSPLLGTNNWILWARSTQNLMVDHRSPHDNIGFMDTTPIFGHQIGNPLGLNPISANSLTPNWRLSICNCVSPFPRKGRKKMGRNRRAFWDGHFQQKQCDKSKDKESTNYRMVPPSYKLLYKPN